MFDHILTYYITASLSQNDCVGPYDLEVEIENRNGKNYLFCYAYRHPGSDIDLFTSPLQPIQPRLFNRQVFIMGDFNVNLLNYDTRNPTYDFVNNLSSNDFLTCINQLKRISAQSSTLIDNIFTNLMDACFIRGNAFT